MSFQGRPDMGAGKFVTEMDDDSFCRVRKLKAKFVDTDKAQMAGYIKDLEKTLQINKEIMTDLFAPSTDSKTDAGQKQLLEKLNRENIHLSGQVQKAIKERDDAQAKLLISEQLSENSKDKEQEIATDCAERERELLVQLDRKEYAVQCSQLRCDRATALLQRYASTHDEVKQYLDSLKADAVGTTQKISNVIEETEELSKELTAAKRRIEDLEMVDHDLRTANEQLTLSINEMKLFGGKPAGAGRTVPGLDLSKVRRPGDKPMTDAGYMHKLEESIMLLSKRTKELETENRELLQKNMQFQNANVSLLKLNTSLSQELQEIREQTKKAERRRHPKDERNKSVIYSPSLMEGKNDHMHRQVTDISTGGWKKSRNQNQKTHNSSFAMGSLIKDDPKAPPLKVGNKSPAQKMQAAMEKDQSFGESPESAEFDKNVNAGGECDPNIKMSEEEEAS